jgi:hypothetical protein
LYGLAVSDVGKVGADQDGSEVVRLEHRLLDPQVRRRPELVRALLHPEFVEFGASGQVWDTESVVVALASAPEGPQMTATDFETVVLAADVILLTFRTDAGGRACLRSSVWARLPGGSWGLRFHQATMLPDGVDVD